MIDTAFSLCVRIKRIESAMGSKFNRGQFVHIA
jgi:hypothetical protein